MSAFVLEARTRLSDRDHYILTWECAFSHFTGPALAKAQFQVLPDHQPVDDGLHYAPVLKALRLNLLSLMHGLSFRSNAKDDPWCFNVKLKRYK